MKGDFIVGRVFHVSGIIASSICENDFIGELIKEMGCYRLVHVSVLPRGAKQSRADYSRAEQSRAEQTESKKKCFFELTRNNRRYTTVIPPRYTTQPFHRYTTFKTSTKLLYHPVIPPLYHRYTTTGSDTRLGINCKLFESSFHSRTCNTHSDRYRARTCRYMDVPSRRSDRW